SLLLPGDRFIIRKFSPVATIGGGVVLDGGGHRHRSPDDVRARLGVLESPDAAARVALLVREAPFGMAMPDLVARTGLLETDRTAAAQKAALMVIAQPQSWYVDRAWFQAARGRLVRAVRTFHAQNPLLLGISKHDLRSRELPQSPPFLVDGLLENAREVVV